MKIERQIDQIIDLHAPAISRGEETIASILQKYPEITAELRPRLEAAIWLLASRAKLEPRANFISTSRTYIEQQIGSLPKPGIWERLLNRYTPRRWVFNVAAPVLIIALIVLIINNVLLATRLAIPGDQLYATKLIFEEVRLRLTFNPIEKTDLYVDYSRERTTEFVELVLEGDYARLPSATGRLEADINASVNSLTMLTPQHQKDVQRMSAELSETLINEVSMLEILKQSSPPAIAPGIEQAIDAAQTGLLALR